jgi:hypothetical protein
MDRRLLSQDALAKVIATLLDTARLDAESLARAQRAAAESKETIAVTLTRLGIVSEKDVADAFASTEFSLRADRRCGARGNVASRNVADHGRIGRARKIAT